MCPFPIYADTEKILQKVSVDNNHDNIYSSDNNYNTANKNSKPNLSKAFKIIKLLLTFVYFQGRTFGLPFDWK